MKTHPRNTKTVKTDAYTHTHARTHTNTHTHTCKHTHTQTHTHQGAVGTSKPECAGRGAQPRPSVGALQLVEGTAYVETQTSTLRLVCVACFALIAVSLGSCPPIKIELIMVHIVLFNAGGGGKKIVLFKYLVIFIDGNAFRYFVAYHRLACPVPLLSRWK